MSDRPPPLSPKILNALDQSNGATTLMEAKVKEFEGYTVMGNAEGVDAARVAAHAFLDARLDAYARAMTEAKAAR